MSNLFYTLSASHPFGVFHTTPRAVGCHKTTQLSLTKQTVVICNDNTNSHKKYIDDDYFPRLHSSRSRNLIGQKPFPDVVFVLLLLYYYLSQGRGKSRMVCTLPLVQYRMHALQITCIHHCPQFSDWPIFMSPPIALTPPLPYLLCYCCCRCRRVLCVRLTQSTNLRAQKTNSGWGRREGGDLILRLIPHKFTLMNERLLK